ncbi:MAG: DUF4037 domain-containing protein, partial [Anaerovoracaceae bacterium]
YLGTREPLALSNARWLTIPEAFLATATNGEVFADWSGEFSAIRARLLAGYPEDVLRKKLAAKVAIMGQAGQYNYGRSCNRGDYYGAYLACNEFIRSSLSAIFLLNGRYMPFYKWAFRSGEELSRLKNAMRDLKELAATPDRGDTARRKLWLIESVCKEVLQELRQRGLSSSGDSFMVEQGMALMEGIKDPDLRRMHLMAE